MRYLIDILQMLHVNMKALCAILSHSNDKKRVKQKSFGVVKTLPFYSCWDEINSLKSLDCGFISFRFLCFILSTFNFIRAKIA
jgi:hypothetical protein